MKFQRELESILYFENEQIGKLFDHIKPNLMGWDMEKTPDILKWNAIAHKELKAKQNAKKRARAKNEKIRKKTNW